MSQTGLPPSTSSSWDDPWKRWEATAVESPPKPLSKAAVTSFAVSLVAMVPLGLVLGGIGLAATGKYDDRQGRGFAWAGIAVSLVWVAVLVGFVAVRVADGPSRSHDGSVSAAGTVDAFDLQLGDCLQAPSAGDVRRVQVTPCTSTHDAQVFAIVQPTAVTYDQAAVTAEVEQMCTQRADVAITSNDPYDVFYLAPSEAGWDGGQRIGMCLLRSSVPLTSSVVAP